MNDAITIVRRAIDETEREFREIPFPFRLLATRSFRRRTGHDFAGWRALLELASERHAERVAGPTFDRAAGKAREERSWLERATEPNAGPTAERAGDEAARSANVSRLRGALPALAEHYRGSPERARRGSPAAANDPRFRAFVERCDARVSAVEALIAILAS